MKLGEFEYDGNGKLLEQNVNYTVFETESGIEAYAENEDEPIEMNKGAFASLRNGKLEKVEGATPMR